MEPPEDRSAETRRHLAELAPSAGEQKQRTAERAALVTKLREQGHGLGEIGDALGVTRSRVQQYQGGQPSNAERRRRRARRTQES
jgi:predicted transcriptional regulator